MGLNRYRPKPPPKSNYITPEGYEVLRSEAQRLWKIERPKVTQEVAAAAAQGDRSENAEYIYGKKRLREIDARLGFLHKRLDVLKVVEPKKGSHEQVLFGSWVCLVDEEDQEVIYQIVGPDEFDVKQLKISMDSPMGKALMGKAVGSEVEVKRPKGEMIFEIIAIGDEYCILKK